MKDKIFVKATGSSALQTTWLIDINSISRINLNHDQISLNDGASIYLTEESINNLVENLCELGMVIEVE